MVSLEPATDMVVAPPKTWKIGVLNFFGTRYRWLSLLLLGWLCLGALGCPTTQVRRWLGKRFLLRQESGCLRFLDQKTGLRFCVPAGTILQISRLPTTIYNDRFEALLRCKGREIQIRVRLDPLPDETSAEALAGPWLRRYAESYAVRRGVVRKQLKLRLLHPKRSRFFRVDAAVWMAFPLFRDRTYAWEEILMLSQKPKTRYLISLRFGDEERQPEQRQALHNFLRLFLGQLRLGQ